MRECGTCDGCAAATTWSLAARDALFSLSGALRQCDSDAPALTRRKASAMPDDAHFPLTQALALLPLARDRSVLIACLCDYGSVAATAKPALSTDHVTGVVRGLAAAATADGAHNPALADALAAWASNMRDEHMVHALTVATSLATAAREAIASDGCRRGKAEQAAATAYAASLVAGQLVRACVTRSSAALKAACAGPIKALASTTVHLCTACGEVCLSPSSPAAAQV